MTQDTKTPTPPVAHQFKDCMRCGQSRPPEGGVDLRYRQWICNPCWQQVLRGQPLRPKK